MITDLLGSYSPMMDSIFLKLGKEGVSEIGVCDHLCYRVETLERYHELVAKLEEFGKNMGEAMVSGRPITIIHLHRPLEYKGFSISCIELPAPKKNNSYKEGWEHAEFVIPKLKQFMTTYKKLDFNTKAMGRKINPELGLRVNKSYQVKFHPLHILDVLIKEKEEGVTEVN